MGLDFALDALYDTGWQSSATMPRLADGRVYPSLDTVHSQFAEAGFDLAVRHIQVFDCYRAEWRNAQGQPGGAVVGQSAEEAAVYALSQLRRQLAAATA